MPLLHSVRMFAVALVPTSTILFLAGPLAEAQDTSAMTGHVMDSSGALLPGVTIVLQNRATGTKFTQTTDSKGIYQFATVPAAQGYTATFSHAGFTTFIVKMMYRY